MVNVCDAIMGTGKTSAAIAYMNEHKNDKFIYITPYLDEAARIKQACPDLHFVEPSNQIRHYRNQKYLHTVALVEQGRNIATTHQAFKAYTPDLLENIQKQGYTLFIDENVDVLEKADFHPDDVQIAIDAGYIAEHDGVYTIVNSGYNGLALEDMFRIMKSRDMVRIEGDESGWLYFWALPPDLLSAFKDVFILTYLFTGQSLHHLIEMNNIPYRYIAVHKIDGGFVFGESPGYIPDYVNHLKDMIDIYEGKMNCIGDGRFDISQNWLTRNTGGCVEILKNNIYNYFRNIWSAAGADRRLWSSYKSGLEKLKGKGYTSSFLSFNTKATNKYKDRDILVYAANVFMNVAEKQYYVTHGIDVDEDAFALSVMVQWIWRSAIRVGRKIHIYIPSRRMRTLLRDWIENVSNGGN